MEIVITSSYEVNVCLRPILPQAFDLYNTLTIFGRNLQPELAFRNEVRDLVIDHIYKDIKLDD